MTFAKFVCNEDGMDTISFGGALAAAMELYEEGVVTREQAGVDLSFGSAEGLVRMAEACGRGEGFGADVGLTYDMDSTSLDAAFTDIQNIGRLRAHTVSAVHFTGVRVDAGGRFRAGWAGNRIQDGFYGLGQAEATGVFEQSNIDGAFGAKR